VDAKGKSLHPKGKVTVSIWCKKMGLQLKRRIRMSYIEELLDQYHTDEYDDLLIDIIKHMKERKENEDE
jgi:glucose-6-phosphate 1-dehydrogenase